MTQWFHDASAPEISDGSDATAQSSDRDAILDVMEKPDALDVTRVSNSEESIAALEPDGHDYAERWTETPTIMIRGPIAVLWGEYEFWIDGEFSHCGVDSADLAKIDGCEFHVDRGDRRLSNRA